MESTSSPVPGPHYRLVSRLGKMLGNYATLEEAERMMGVSFHSKFIIAVDKNGAERVAYERKELN